MIAQIHIARRASALDFAATSRWNVNGADVYVCSKAIVP
jgi:hypothetical protein